MNQAMIGLQMNQQGVPTSLALLPLCIICISLEGLLHPAYALPARLLGADDPDGEEMLCCYKSTSFEAQTVPVSLQALDGFFKV